MPFFPRECHYHPWNLSQTILFSLLPPNKVICLTTSPNFNIIFYEVIHPVLGVCLACLGWLLVFCFYFYFICFFFFVLEKYTQQQQKVLRNGWHNPLDKTRSEKFLFTFFPREETLFSQNMMFKTQNIWEKSQTIYPYIVKTSRLVFFFFFFFFFQ